MLDMINFLNKLENKKIYYKLNKIRDDAIMVEVSVPGERWEIEFFAKGNIEIERFLSNGTVYNRSELETLFKNFSD